MLPNLDAEKTLAIDIETFDPNLKELGPGCRRKDGHILGVSIASADKEWYFPVGHSPETLAGVSNLDNLWPWLRDLFLDKDRLWITANGMYDFDWLQYTPAGVPAGLTHDIQWIEPLLDENKPSYALDLLGHQYLGTGKEVDEIADYCKDRGWKGDSRIHLSKVPMPMVAKYAKMDTRLTFDVHTKQLPRIEEQGLGTVLDLESRLTPFYLQLRRTGVRIDTKKLEPSRTELQGLIGKAQAELDSLAGFPVNVNASRQIEKLFQRENLRYECTEKGNPSFTADFLETVDHPAVHKILEVRELAKIDGTFLEGLSNYQVNGRIAPMFHPLKGGWGGTVSGRYSSSNPNLQNQPSRSKRGKALVRGLFIPEDGMMWSKTDYSQIEYRIFAHYALGPGSDELRQKFNENPKLDLHQYTADLMGCDRTKAKTINFGIIYGMGAKKLAAALRMESGADVFLNKYHRTNPFMKHTLRVCSDVAKDRGYVKTILGRRARIEPGREFVALNRVVQGSAADVMKTAMLKAYEAGIYNVLVPHLTVHDELDNSVPMTKEGVEASKEQTRIFESAIPFRVPILTESELGENWASVSKEQYQEFLLSCG